MRLHVDTNVVCSDISDFTDLSALPSITVFEKNNLRVQFALERDPTDPLTLNITLTATNGSAVAVNDFVFQAAVPKVKPTWNCLPSL